MCSTKQNLITLALRRLEFVVIAHFLRIVEQPGNERPQKVRRKNLQKARNKPHFYWVSVLRFASSWQPCPGSKARVTDFLEAEKKTGILLLICRKNLALSKSIGGIVFRVT
jgi:hypothetical protein